MIKFCIDGLGNTYEMSAQFAEAQGEYVLNQNSESFVSFPEIPEGKTVELVPGADATHGNWQIIDIPAENVFDKDIGFIRPKNPTERIVSGLDPVPAGMKVSGSELVPMTLDEQLAANQITADQYSMLSNAPVFRQLQNIDNLSIRAMREWLITQPITASLLTILLGHDTAAGALRVTLKK